jgi:hypothetical protein
MCFFKAFLISLDGNGHKFIWWLKLCVPADSALFAILHTSIMIKLCQRHSTAERPSWQEAVKMGLRANGYNLLFLIGVGLYSLMYM